MGQGQSRAGQITANEIMGIFEAVGSSAAEAFGNLIMFVLARSSPVIFPSVAPWRVCEQAGLPACSRPPMADFCQIITLACELYQEIGYLKKGENSRPRNRYYEFGGNRTRWLNLDPAPGQTAAQQIFIASIVANMRRRSEYKYVRIFHCFANLCEVNCDEAEDWLRFHPGLELFQPVFSCDMQMLEGLAVEVREFPARTWRLTALGCEVAYQLTGIDWRKA